MVNHLEIAELIAVFIAMFALAISISEMRRSRLSYDLGKLPLLRPALGVTEDDYACFSISNEGNGTALIEKFDVFVDGELQQTLHHAIVNVLGPNKVFLRKKYLHSNPRTISPGEQVVLFEVKEDARSVAEPRSPAALHAEFAFRMGIHTKYRPLNLKDAQYDIKEIPLAKQRANNDEA